MFLSLIVDLLYYIFNVISITNSTKFGTPNFHPTRIFNAVCLPKRHAHMLVKTGSYNYALRITNCALLLVVFSAGIYLKRTVKLFKEHYPRKLMRERHFRH